jgi:hypothetical protein
MSVSSILVSWIKSRANGSDPWFFSYNLESEVPMYGKLAHRKLHSASTYSRGFRKLREGNTLELAGLRLVEFKENDKRVKGWKVEKL